MVARTRDFYQRFFDYPLSDAEAHLILLGLPIDAQQKAATGRGLMCVLRSCLRTSS
jgi:hypothetical protein